MNIVNDKIRALISADDVSNFLQQYCLGTIDKRWVREEKIDGDVFRIFFRLRRDDHKFPELLKDMFALTRGDAYRLANILIKCSLYCFFPLFLIFFLTHENHNKWLLKLH